MKLPKIELSSLPDMTTLTGMFGSAADPTTGTPGPDDSIVVLATLVWESGPPLGGLL